jgi:hypothetical protein
MAQNYHVESGQGGASSPLICIEFKHLRRSSRLPPTKRDYGKMQGTSNRAGRPAKKTTLVVDKPVDVAPPTSNISRANVTGRGSLMQLPFFTLWLQNQDPVSCF